MCVGISPLNSFLAQKACAVAAASFGYACTPLLNRYLIDFANGVSASFSLIAAKAFIAPCNTSCHSVLVLPMS
jgi:hypothetical protein